MEMSYALGGIRATITDLLDCGSLQVTYELAYENEPDDFKLLDTSGFTNQFQGDITDGNYFLRRMVDGVQVGPIAEDKLIEIAFISLMV